MGTHPIFESDFDCLTECIEFLLVFYDRVDMADSALPGDFLRLLSRWMTN